MQKEPAGSFELSDLLRFKATSYVKFHDIYEPYATPWERKTLVLSMTRSSKCR
jgi:hypothetical protein